MGYKEDRIVRQRKMMQWYAMRHPEMTEYEAGIAWSNKYAVLYRKQQDGIYEHIKGRNKMMNKDTHKVKEKRQWVSELGESSVRHLEHNGILKDINEDQLLMCTETGKRLQFRQWASVLGDEQVLDAEASGIFVPVSDELIGE